MVVCSNSVPTADEKRFPQKRPSFRVVKFFYANPVLNLLTSTKSSVPKPMIPVGSIKCSDIYHKQFSSLCPSQLNQFVVGQNEQVSLIPFSPFSFDSLRLCQWYVRRNQINEKWPLGRNDGLSSSRVMSSEFCLVRIIFVFKSVPR